jgi:hypothetical protein
LEFLIPSWTRGRNWLYGIFSTPYEHVSEKIALNAAAATLIFLPFVKVYKRVIVLAFKLSRTAKSSSKLSCAFFLMAE